MRITGAKAKIKEARRNFKKGNDIWVKYLSIRTPQSSLKIWGACRFRDLYKEVKCDKGEFIKQCLERINDLTLEEAPQHEIDMYERIFNKIN